MGTEDRNLMRLTVSRCEIDLGNIKEKYQAIYGNSLSNAVSVRLVSSKYGFFKDALSDYFRKLG